MDKRCGTCRWWENAVEGNSYFIVGPCAAPIPDSAKLRNESGLMTNTEGTTCPTYEEKEQNDG